MRRDETLNGVAASAGLLAGILILLVAAAPGESREKIDGVVALVGDSIILESELEAYTLMRLNSGDVRADSIEIDSLRGAFLEELVNDKVFEVHVGKDSTVSLRPEEVEEALERHVQAIMQENRMSIQELDRELQDRQGIGIAEFKTQIRKGLRKQLLRQKVLQRYMAAMHLTRKEVEAFYSEYKDSLPEAGKSVRMLKLSMEIAPSDSVRQAAYDRIGTIRERLSEGEDFAELAKQFSEDPNAEMGGDLGFISKGTLNELEFEERAFSLQPGETSDIFESRIGFHILKAEAKKGQEVHIRQILIQVAPPKHQIDAVSGRLDSIRTHCSNAEQFSDAVAKFSADDQTKARNGDTGWRSIYTLPTNLATAMDTLPEGGISHVVRDGDIYSIYRLEKRAESRPYTLEDDWDMLAEKARDIYAQKRLFDLVRKWREREFVDIRL